MLCFIKMSEVNETKHKTGVLYLRVCPYFNLQCSICDRPANGMKYNAVSCDACRVFFGRIVKEQDSNPTSITCKCGKCFLQVIAQINENF